MTTTALPTTGLDVIEALDFDPELACEHTQHVWKHRPDDPAAWVVRGECPDCPWVAVYLLCDSGLRILVADGLVGRLVCHGCKTPRPFSDFMAVLGPVRTH